MSAHSPYSRTAITLHWVVAVLIIANLAGGLLMGGMLDSTDPEQRRLGFTIVQLHKRLPRPVRGRSRCRCPARRR